MQVLIAEQLQAAVAKIIIGLTSAGRLAKDLPLPSLVIATSAVRDEGTSYHYLAPSQEVTCPTAVSAHLERELEATGWNVRSGKVWTTDAPYRETREQIDKWASENVLAVEMQTASLFAFAIARQASVASVVMVSNAVDHQGEQFDTGSPDDGFRILQGIAGRRGRTSKRCNAFTVTLIEMAGRAESRVDCCRARASEAELRPTGLASFETTSTDVARCAAGCYGLRSGLTCALLRGRQRPKEDSASLWIGAAQSASCRKPARFRLMLLAP